MIDLNEIFKFSEKVNVEVNAAQGGITNSIWETYSSFTNTFGGTIILGIGEDSVGGYDASSTSITSKSAGTALISLLFSSTTISPSVI